MREQPKRRLDTAERIGVLWCWLMHDAPMWPIHGSYRCRICRRSSPVPWDKHLLQPARLVIQQGDRVVESGA
jgi:hypothetical protein